MQKFFVVLKLVFGAMVLVVSSNLVFASELILFSEEEMVVTASRHEQKISEAPSAITVITAEDIHQSGATNIPDILRMVPGLDVMFISATDLNVSARGFNHRLSNKILVMVDGRPIYLKLLGNVFWESLSVSLEEIEKIEIIRGPGSALYGANAYCGVIHIITKSAEKLKGTAVSFTGGEYNTYLGSLIHAGAMDKLDYKISLGWYQTDQWTEEKESIDGIPRGNIAIGYEINDISKLSLSGGHGETVGEMAAGHIPMEKEGKTDYFQANYSLKDLKLLSYWERIKGETTNLATLQKDSQEANTYEIEMQHALNLLEKHSIVWGGSFRHCIVESEMIKDEEQKEDTWGIYLQDEVKLIDPLTIVLGGRYDYHSGFGGHTTPRTSVIYSPVKNHTFRISAATAFRAPTFIESYVETSTTVEIPVPAPFPPFSINIPTLGNEDLNPEKITAYEIGYQTLLMERIKGRIDLFYNEYKDFIDARTGEMYAANELFPGSPGGIIPKYYTYLNRGETDGRGGEISVDVLIAEWLTGTVNYSYEKIIDRDDDPVTTRNEKNERRVQSPLNKANAGLRAKLKNGVSLNVIAHYVDEVQFLGYQKLDAYTIVNVRLGYQINDNLEIAIAAFNLFNDEHYEYTPGIMPSLTFGEEIGRKVTGNINYKF